jgi:hypothetical protein
MTAEPILTLVTRLMARHRLEGVLIGNAAAALQGSPVTTIDLDFMFRKTARNLAKLKRLADDLDGSVLRPYPAHGEADQFPAEATARRLSAVVADEITGT